ncbi:fatty acid desaturase family protein [Fodinicola feengrottensis]|uniref:Acyl-CoA desaturase n=1 Tax=Fodinicola feengrottensis TaxID=435914 RepID=A0ABN2I165_9ACTN|nr:acyl-CoA desaturase [Fodinicola feengrottensis]
MPAATLAERPIRRNQISDYTELAKIVREKGLLNRRVGWYFARIALLAGLFAVPTVLLVTLGHSWWQLAVAAVFGILVTQVAFLSHDAAHRQVFAAGKHNEWFSRIVGCLVVGLSYRWWMNKHSRHHANPNQVGKDGDIEAGALVFTADEARERTGLAGWLVRRQGWFFFPLLTLAGIDLHITAVRTLLSPDRGKHRNLELALLAIRLLAFPLLVLWILGIPLGLAFIAVQLVTFGVYMGASFAPNHKGMPIVPPTADIDFLRRQVLMSRNIRGRGMGVAMGGLNYQIEHHLFPSMPSGNLRLARPIVQRYCAERGISYTETTLVHSYAIVVRYLNRVGLGHSDPFECPITAQFRSR